MSRVGPPGPVPLGGEIVISPSIAAVIRDARVLPTPVTLADQAVLSS